MSSQQEGCMFIVVGVLVFLMAGGIPYFFVIKELSKVIPTNSWTAIPAKLNKVKFETYKSRDEDGNTTYSYATVINYTYLWESVEMQGKRVSYSYRSSSDMEFHQKFYAKISQAKSIEIYVNPSKPTEAVIVRGFIKGGGTIIIWTMSLIGFGIGLLLVRSFTLNQTVKHYTKHLLLVFFFQYLIGLIFILTKWENSDLIEKIVFM